MRAGNLIHLMVFGLMAAAAPAVAQTTQAAPAANGQVTILDTEPGSVMVERGGQVYQLKKGDAIFEGDRIFTRTNGALRFSINGCDIGLGGQQMIVVNGPAVCTTPPTSLAYEAKIGGVQVGTGATLAATPTLLAAALVTGGAAAAGSGGSSGASP